MTDPVLIAVAHGTRTPSGPRTVTALLDAVRAALPGVTVVQSYVELNSPEFSSIAPRLVVPAVVVPLLLSQGFHTQVDLPGFTATASVPLHQTPALGPDPLLAEAVWDRVMQAEAGPADAVVLLGAGSSDPAGRHDVSEMARLVSSRSGLPCEAAFLTGAGQTAAQAAQRLRQSGAKRLVVAPYLLAPGFFLAKAQRVSREIDAVGCAPCLAEHPALVELISTRYRQGVLQLAKTASVGELLRS